jgi:hypothetical protein
VAQVNDYDLYLRLSRVFNNSLGSSGPGRGISPSEKVTLKPVNESLIEARYQGIVTFTTDKVKDSLMPKFQNQAMGLVESTLKRATKGYEKEFSGKTLKFEIKTNTIHEDVEFLHYNAHNPVRRANYRIYCLIEVIEKDD